LCDGSSTAQEISCTRLALGVAFTKRDCLNQRLDSLYSRARGDQVQKREPSSLAGARNVKPFYRTESRPAAWRSTPRPLRPVRIPVARQQRPDCDHPQCQPQCGCTSSGCNYRVNIDT